MSLNELRLRCKYDDACVNANIESLNLDSLHVLYGYEKDKLRKIRQGDVSENYKLLESILELIKMREEEMLLNETEDEWRERLERERLEMLKQERLEMLKQERLERLERLEREIMKCKNDDACVNVILEVLNLDGLRELHAYEKDKLRKIRQRDVSENYKLLESILELIKMREEEEMLLNETEDEWRERLERLKIERIAKIERENLERLERLEILERERLEKVKLTFINRWKINPHIFQSDLYDFYLKRKITVSGTFNYPGAVYEFLPRETIIDFLRNNIHILIDNYSARNKNFLSDLLLLNYEFISQDPEIVDLLFPAYELTYNFPSNRSGHITIKTIDDELWNAIRLQLHLSDKWGNNKSYNTSYIRTLLDDPILEGIEYIPGSREKWEWMMIRSNNIDDRTDQLYEDLFVNKRYLYDKFKDKIGDVYQLVMKYLEDKEIMILKYEGQYEDEDKDKKIIDLDDTIGKFEQDFEKIIEAWLSILNIRPLDDRYENKLMLNIRSLFNHSVEYILEVVSFTEYYGVESATNLSLLLEDFYSDNPITEKEIKEFCDYTRERYNLNNLPLNNRYEEILKDKMKVINENIDKPMYMRYSIMLGDQVINTLIFGDTIKLTMDITKNIQKWFLDRVDNVCTALPGGEEYQKAQEMFQRYK